MPVSPPPPAPAPAPTPEEILAGLPEETGPTVTAEEFEAGPAVAPAEEGIWQEFEGEDEEVAGETAEQRRKRKEERRKRQTLVFDEALGKVVAKRKRKASRARDWTEEVEE
jgi:hypothetical protein